MIRSVKYLCCHSRPNENAPTEDINVYGRYLYLRIEKLKMILIMKIVV